MAGKKKESAVAPQRWEDVPEIPKEEQPYPLPDGWKWVKLLHIASWGSGGTPSRKHPEYYTGNIAWLKTGELEDNEIYSTDEHLTYEAINNSSVKLFPINTVVMAMYGATIGKLGILKIEATTNQACACAKCFDFIFYKYLFFYLLSQRDEFIKLGKGGAQPNISQEVIKNYLIPLPTFESQQRIVTRIESLFSKLDEAAEKVQAVINSHEARKQAILHKAFSGGLMRDVEIKEEDSYKEIPEIPKEEQPYPLPQGWKWVKIKDLYQINPKVKADDTVTASFVPMAKISSGTTGNFTYEIKPWEKIKKGFTQFEDGDVAFAKISPCFENGKKMLVQNLENGIGAGTTELIILRNKNVSQKFSLYLISTDRFVKNGIKTYSGTVGQQRINMDYVQNYPIPLPPIQTQQRIIARIESLFSQLDEVIEASEKILDKIKNMKNSILTLSFQGKLC